jgi:hypothetical protein
MSVLQVLARRAIIQHCKNNGSILSHLRMTNHSARSSSYVARALISRAQLTCSGGVGNCTENGGGLQQQRGTGPEHMISSDFLFKSRMCSSVELVPHFSNGRRKFSSNAPQKEPQHIPSVGSANLQNEESDQINTSASAPKDPSKDSISTASTSLETDQSPGKIPASKPTTTTIAKKESPIIKKAKDATMYAIKSLVSLLTKTPGILWFYLTHPTEFRKKLAQLKEAAVKEAHHYWMGSKVSTLVYQKTFPYSFVLIQILVNFYSTSTSTATCCRY